jgi:hypothetical protein
MSSDNPPVSNRKIKPPSPHAQIRKVMFNRCLRATQATDAKPHKGLFNKRIRQVKAKHAKHQPKYRVRIPSDAQMFNVRHYTVSAGLSRFE